MLQLSPEAHSMPSPTPACHDRPVPDVLDVEQRGDDVCFRVRVAPRASRAAVLGVHDGAIKVSLTAPPVGGAANAALIKLLARLLGVARSRVSIERGDRSRDKMLQVQGVDVAEVRALVDGLDG